MKKRFAALVLALLMLITTVPISAASDTEPAAFAAGTVTGSRGQQVQVPITIENNSGIISLKLNVAYDATVLKLVSNVGGIFTGTVFGKDTTVNPVPINWFDGVATENYTDNGVVATLTFEILADAPFGESAITITYDPDNVFDFDYENVDFAIKNGSVTVVCPHTATTTHEAKPSTCIQQGNAAYTTCNDCGEVVSGSDAKLPLADHVFTNACDASCNTEGCTFTRTPDSHKYENDCDTTCDVCGDVREVEGHQFDNDCDTTCNECGSVRAIPENAHVFTNDCDASCNTTGCTFTRTPADHVYKNACDADCDECGATRTPAAHVYKNACDADCDVCGATRTPSAHVYDNACDADCNVCGQSRTPADHVYSDKCDDTCNVCGAVRTVGAHEFDNVCDTTCNECGATRTVPHVYTNACDATCNTAGCGFTRTPADHVYENACDATCNVCGATRTPSAHVYDNNCDANCNVCGQARTPSAHVYTNSCDTTCNECGATRTITHTWESKWTTDSGKHWHKCSVCGEKKDEAVHGYTNNCDAECNTCGYTRTPSAHVYTNSCDTSCNECGDERTITHTWESKWTTDGEKHWHKCSVCGASKGDEADHTGGTATCQVKKQCSVCSTSYGTTVDHSYTKEDTAAKYLKSVATCVAKAEYFKSCTMCGLASTTETFTTGAKNPDNHVGGTEVKDALAPKCDKEGYTGDTYCKGCGVMTKAGTKIEKLPHEIKTWEVSKEPTTTECGEKTGKCTGCSEEFKVETAKLVSEIKTEKIEGLEKVEIQILGDTNINEDVVFVAEEVLETITQEEKKDVETAVEKAIETLKEELKDEMKEEVKDHKLAAVFDLKLILRETTTTGEKVAETELKLEGKVKVTVPVPAIVTEKFENIKLIHVKDDGSVEFVPFTMKDGLASFEATGFSYYTFVGTEKVVETPTTTTAPATSATVPTGDSTGILWSVTGLVVALAGMMIVSSKRRSASHR